MIEIVPNWHPVWVHFTVGLLIMGTLFYAFALVGAKQSWSHQALNAARWNLLAGILFAVFSLVTGWLAANSVAHDDAGHANMMAHRNWALIAAFLFVVAVVWLCLHWRGAREKASIVVLAFLLAGSAALGVTGFKGGVNVFEHGLGVQRLPDTESHHHHHHSEGILDDHEVEEMDSDHADPHGDEHMHDHSAEEGETMPEADTP